jgi:hypothetical protein
VASVAAQTPGFVLSRSHVPNKSKSGEEIKRGEMMNALAPVLEMPKQKKARRERGQGRIFKRQGEQVLVGAVLSRR